VKYHEYSRNNYGTRSPTIIDDANAESLVDYVKSTAKKCNGYKYVSVSPAGHTDEGKVLGLVVAHKETPINDSGLLISKHSKFVEAVVVTDDQFKGILLDRKGVQLQVPEEPKVACSYCGVETPKSLMTNDACYACIDMAKLVSNHLISEGAEPSKELTEVATKE